MTAPDTEYTYPGDPTLTEPPPVAAKPLDLDAIRERCEAATPGPWRVDTEEADDVVIWGQRATGDDREGVFIGNVGASAVGEVGVAFDIDAKNGAFIANARQDIPALLSALAEEHRIGVAWMTRCRLAEKERDRAVASVRLTAEECRSSGGCVDCCACPQEHMCDLIEIVRAADARAKP